MHRKPMLLTALAGAVTVLLTACAGTAVEPQSSPAPSATPGTVATGSAVFAVSDAAADMGAVSRIELTIDSVRVHQEGGAWVQVSDEDKTFSLLDLNASGTAELLASAELAVGAYDQMELVVSRVIVTDADGSHEAKLPSGALRLQGELKVESNSTATADFDFIAHQSLHVTGEGAYVLAPVVHLETRQDAQVEINANNEVEVTGGSTTTDARIGMDIEGNVGLGLFVPADAIIKIDAAGGIIQTGGRALVAATIQGVDAANGVVTISTRGGKQVQLHMANDSAIVVDGQAVTLADLSDRVGSEVTAAYNAETKALASIGVGVDAAARAEAGSTLRIGGVIKSVNATAGTITIETDDGAEVVLNVKDDVHLNVGGVLSGLSGLGSRIGARVEAEYDARTGMVTEVDGKADATATVTGVLKGVDPANAIVTIEAESGSDMVLKVDSGSRILVNGSLATMAALRSMVGSDVSAEYRQESRKVVGLSAHGQAERSATITGMVLSVDTSAGTITVLTETGTQLVLNVTAGARLLLDDSATTLASLVAQVGSRVAVDYDAATQTVTVVRAESEADASATASATVAGTVQSVNALTNTMTVVDDMGATLALTVTSNSELYVNGATATVVDLATKIGSQVRVEYNVETKAIVTLNA